MPSSESAQSVVRLRAGQPTDGDALADIHLLALAQAMPGLPVLYSRDRVRRWMEESVLAESAVWVAEAVSGVVGYLCLRGPLVDQLYVAPDWQGKGVGTALLGRAQHASPQGLELFVFQRNRGAREFYEAHGFELVDLNDGSRNEEHEPDAFYRWTAVAGS